MTALFTTTRSRQAVIRNHQLLAIAGRWADADHVSRSAPRRISTHAYLVLRAVMVFDALLLVVASILLWLFMEHPAGVAGSGLCCLAAGMSLGGARWLDRMYDRAR